MPTPRATPTRISVWVISAVLAFAFLAFGGAKLAGHPSAVEAFDRWGYPDGFRPVVGLMEVLAAILLLWQPTRVYGGALVVFVMLGAVLTHMITGQWIIIPIPLAIAAAAAWVVWAERPNDLQNTYPEPHSPWA